MKKALPIILAVVAVVALVFGIVSTVNGNNTKKDLEAVIAEKQTEIDAAKEELTASQAELTASQAELTASREELTASQAELTASQNELSESKAKEEELTGQVTQLTTQVDEQTARINELTAQVTELESRQAAEQEKEAAQAAPLEKGAAEAEEQEKAALPAGPENEMLSQQAALFQNAVLKYFAQGQEAVCTISMNPGEALLSMGGANEQMNAAMGDLFRALGIRLKAQAVEKQVQGGLDVCISDESVAGITVAADGETIYISSNLLGEGICAFTGEELTKLVEEAAKQAGAGNSQTAQILNMLKGILSGDSQQYAAELARQLGSLDLTKLNEALKKLTSNTESLEVTEAPEKMPDAYGHTRITLKREDLKEVMSEAGKVLWSIPSLQQMLQQNKVDSEEKLAGSMAAVIDRLQEDIVIDIYLNRDQAMLFQVAASVIKAEGENARPVNVEILVSPKTNGSVTEGVVTVRNGESSNTLNITVEQEGNEINCSADMTVEDQEGKWQKAAVTVKAVSNKTETSSEKTTDMVITVKNARDAEARTMTVKEVLSEQDLGDHAEGNFKATIGMEGLGELMTLNCDLKTGIAEAYIITKDAMHPLSMSQEEQAKWIESLQTNAQMVLMTALTKLPASVLQLLNGGSAN